MKRTRQLSKHFCEINLNRPNEKAEFFEFHFFNFNSVVTISCHCNRRSYHIGIKRQLFVSISFRSNFMKYEKNRYHGFGGTFENIDDGRTTDAYLHVCYLNVFTSRYRYITMALKYTLYKSLSCKI